MERERERERERESPQSFTTQGEDFMIIKHVCMWLLHNKKAIHVCTTQLH